MLFRLGDALRTLDPRSSLLHSPALHHPGGHETATSTQGSKYRKHPSPAYRLSQRLSNKKYKEFLSI